MRAERAINEAISNFDHIQHRSPEPTAQLYTCNCKIHSLYYITCNSKASNDTKELIGFILTDTPTIILNTCAFLCACAVYFAHVSSAQGPCDSVLFGRVASVCLHAA